MTKYKPHQQEECRDQYRKSCHIKSGKKAVTETVDVCRTPLVKNCSNDPISIDDNQNENCKTVYESECWTRLDIHEVNLLFSCLLQTLN